MTQPGFVLKCLGVPELRTRDGRIVRIRVKKHLALLVYLAVERRRSHERARLAELLWPDAPSDKARHSCATALSILRRVVGGSAFTTVRRAVRFTPGDFELDLDRLEAGELIGPGGEAIIEVDGFLRGFDIDDAPDFCMWKEREHVRRLPTIHAGLLTLIDHGRRRGSHDEILERAERLLEIDRLAEEGIRAKMEALALAGDRVSALRVFDDWKDRLKEEVGAEPSVMVEGMAAQLRKRGWEAKEPNPVPVPAEQWRDRQFVGRQAEYRALYDTWEAIHHFRPRHYLITGDSGVGKTTLAQRLVTAAGLEGASVSRVQCYQMEQRLPFAAIAGLVRGLLGQPGIAATSPDALAEIARLVPQTALRFPNLPRAKESEGETARLLFADALVDLLEAVMNEKPLLLVLDDLHHADEASAAVLHFILRRISSSRAMVIVTARVDSALSSQARRFVEEVTPAFASRIDVKPMTADECGLLLSAILQGGLSPSTMERRALVAASRGNPMALELLAHDWRLNGACCLALALRAYTTALPTGSPSVPDPLEQIADRLLCDLDRTSRRVLYLAAVLGQHLDNLPAYSILDLSVSQTIDGLSELTERRVLRDVGGGLEFINELLRAHVYRRLPTATRVRIHDAIADRALGGQLQLPNLELGWHLMRAGRQTEAAEHLLKGAAAALIRGAADDAVLAIRSSLPDLPDFFIVEATQLLAQGLLELGRWREALDAIALLNGRGSGDMLRVIELEARWRLGIISGSHLGTAVDELLGLAERSAIAGRCILIAASMAGNLLDDDRLASASLAATRRKPSDRTEAAMLATARAIAAYYRRDADNAEKTARQAIGQLLDANRADSRVVQLRIGLGVIHSSQGKYDRARDEQMTARAMAHRLGNEQLYFQAGANACLAALRLGDYDQVVELASDLLGNSDFANNPSLGTNNANLTYALGCAYGLQNKPELALAAIARNSLLCSALSNGWLGQVWALYRADVLWLAGRKAQSRKEAARAVGDRYPPASRGVTGSYCRWLAILGTTGLGNRFAPRIAAEAFSGRQALDVLDQLEVSIAVRAICARSDGDRAEAAGQVIRELEGRLPDATFDFLSRFAIMPEVLPTART